MNFGGGKAGDAVAKGAVQEATLEEPGAEKTPSSPKGRGERSGCFAGFVGGLGPEAGVLLAARPMIGGVSKGVVIDLALEGGNGAG